jgi:monoamine oxidase
MLKLGDVIVVGAGAAGLAAAVELGRAGLSTTILEARDRIGGRMFTQIDPVTGHPVEFGAEFVHGLPPEIWRPLRARDVAIKEVSGEPWCFENLGLAPCNFFGQIDEVLAGMDGKSPDESFLSFLDRHYPQAEINGKNRALRRRALSYITGFNAADPGRVGVHWLSKGMRAEKRIEGGCAFRSENGYQDLLKIFRDELVETKAVVRTETRVDEVEWAAGHARVSAHQAGEPCRLASRRLLVTLPLGVLRARPDDVGAVRFTPQLPQPKLDALCRLEMGKVVRVTLRFRERFWDTITPRNHAPATLSEMGFLFSEDEWFPTWWTTMPDRFPILVGWSPAHCAEKLAGQSRSVVIERGLKTLSRLLGVEPARLAELMDAAYFHDWQADPFSRGAYSYGAAGSDGAQEALGEPLKNTIFFAGEATDTSGHNGTVHGAISSGRRAAKEILKGLD